MASWDRVHICHLVPSRPLQLSQHWEGETLLVLVSCHHGHDHDENRWSRIIIAVQLGQHWKGYLSSWVIIGNYFAASVFVTMIMATMIIFMIIRIILIIIIAEPPLPQLPLTLLQLRRTSLTPCRPTSDPPKIYWNRKFLFCNQEQNEFFNKGPVWNLLEMVEKFNVTQYPRLENYSRRVFSLQRKLVAILYFLHYTVKDSNQRVSSSKIVMSHNEVF